MTFDCSKVVPGKCKADCCGPVPIEKEFYQKHFYLKQRDIIGEREFNADGQDFIIPETKDLTCIFLNKDYKCMIYNDRPFVCKKFGDGTHKCMTCPYIKPNGKLRKGVK